MVSLLAAFWFLIGLFGVVGFLRGWTKEVIALCGLVLSLFAINQFGPTLVGLFVNTPFIERTEPVNPLRVQFWVLALVHVFIAFFSYQGATLANNLGQGRFAVRLHENMQERILGLIFGLFNGYLIIGSIWSFLEFDMTSGGYNRLLPGVQYALAPNIIRPLEISGITSVILNYLPLPFLAPYLTFLIVLVVLFLIIVII